MKEKEQEPLTCERGLVASNETSQPMDLFCDGGGVPEEPHLDSEKQLC